MRVGTRTLTEMADNYLFGINFTVLKDNMAALICDLKDCQGCPYFKGYDKPCLFHEFLAVSEKAAEVYDKYEPYDDGTTGTAYIYDYETEQYIPWKIIDWNE